MSDQLLLPQAVSPASSSLRVTRVEYVDYKDVGEHREFGFRAYGPDGSSGFRIRIAREAFDARRIRIQDGPDVCYQKLLRTIAAGVTPPEEMTIDDGDLSSYRDEHTPVVRHRSRPPSSAATPVVPPRTQPLYRPRTLRPDSTHAPVTPPVTDNGGPALKEGQRVNHAVFGVGVTTAITPGRTVVRFDRDGPKTFVTSMLELEVLSAPHTWETTARGMNRLRKTPAVVSPTRRTGE